MSVQGLWSVSGEWGSISGDDSPCVALAIGAIGCQCGVGGI